MSHSYKIYFELSLKHLTKGLMDDLANSLKSINPRRLTITKSGDLPQSYFFKLNEADLYEFTISCIFKHSYKNFYGHLPEDKAFIILSIRESAFYIGWSEDEEKEKREVKQKLNDFLEYAKAIYYAIKPINAVGMHELQNDDYNFVFGNDIFWLNFFSPEKVKQLGRHKLLTAPAEKVEELNDGSVLIVSTLNPQMSGVEIRQKIAQHLGLTGGKRTVERI